MGEMNTRETTPTEIDEALAEIAAASALRRGRPSLMDYVRNQHAVPRAVGAVQVAVRRGRMVMEGEYTTKQVSKLCGFGGHQIQMGMLNLQMDLAIWRAPIKLTEIPSPGDQAKKYRLELR